jgi:hypothetical protein
MTTPSTPARTPRVGDRIFVSGTDYRKSLAVANINPIRESWTLSNGISIWPDGVVPGTDCTWTFADPVPVEDSEAIKELDDKSADCEIRDVLEGFYADYAETTEKFTKPIKLVLWARLNKVMNRKEGQRLASQPKTITVEAEPRLPKKGERYIDGRDIVECERDHLLAACFIVIPNPPAPPMSIAAASASEAAAETLLAVARGEERGPFTGEKMTEAMEAVGKLRDQATMPLALDALEAANADNAALVEACHAFSQNMLRVADGGKIDDEANGRAWEALRMTHPGAAILAELQRLRQREAQGVKAWAAFIDPYPIPMQVFQYKDDMEVWSKLHEDQGYTVRPVRIILEDEQ